MAEYQTIRVDPLTVHIGAQVDGVDLKRSLNDLQETELRDALARHLVLFFRDQDLTEQEQLSFARCFGPPVSSNVIPRDGDDDLVFVDLEDTPDSPPKADRWHTDVAFVATPPDVAILNMRSTPPVGGDTMWLSLYAAYDGLSPTMQRALAELDIELDMGTTKDAIRELYGEEYYREVADQYENVTHPLVRIHPVTRRPLLFMCGSFMRGIVGMHPSESEALLGLLRGRLDDPNLHCRWRWQPYDVVVWDERCTNHRALSDHYPAYRRIRRCLSGRGVPEPASRLHA